MTDNALGQKYERGPEPFFTLRDAAAELNLKYWQLLRMSKRGELTIYFAGNKRARVRLTEVVDSIRKYSAQGVCEGGDQ